MKDKSTILVVDDDNAHRIMLRTLIGGWGYEVSEADDGAAAIDQVKEQSYDLVLMDVRMVQVSGLEALAQDTLRRTCFLDFGDQPDRPFLAESGEEVAHQRRIGQPGAQFGLRPDRFGRRDLPPFVGHDPVENGRHDFPVRDWRSGR